MSERTRSTSLAIPGEIISLTSPDESKILLPLTSADAVLGLSEKLPVMEGYMIETLFYEDAAGTIQITGKSGFIYVDLLSDNQYRWDGTAFKKLSSSDGDMLASTYDPTNKAQDIYSYADAKESAIKDAAVKDTPIDTDSFALVDSADANKTKRVLWSRVKAVLKGWFDTLYAAVNHTHSAADVGARPATWTPTAADVGAVPTTRKVNNKAMDADISLTAADVDALPTTGGTVNGGVTLTGRVTAGSLSTTLGSVIGDNETSEHYGLWILGFAGDVWFCDPVDEGDYPRLKCVKSPIDDFDAANKGYVDAETAKCLPLTGGTVDGNVTLNGDLTFPWGSRIFEAETGGDLYIESVSGDVWFRNMAEDGPTRLKRVNSPVEDTDAANKRYVDGKARGKNVEVTLPASGWLGEAAPYSQTVTVTGVTASSNGSAEVADSATDEQWTAAQNAGLRKSAQGENTMTFKVYGEKPTVDIPISVVFWG